jgi:hypothetical protein
LVVSDNANTPADPTEDEQGQLESELALDRRQMRRDLAAKLLDDHVRKLATTEAPRSARTIGNVELGTEGRDQTPSTLKLVSAGPQQGPAAALAQRESPAPFAWAGAIVAALASWARIATSALRKTKRERPAAISEIDRLELELETALERRRMRRALASTLVDECRNAPERVAPNALRAALVNRDLTEEECEALDRALSKARNRSRDAGQAG